MKSNRRKFLKFSSLLGLGVAGGKITGNATAGQPHPFEKTSGRTDRDHFNMSGYAAPKLETVRIGFIGLGNRGPGAVERMRHIEGVSINALCDIRPEKAAAVKKV